MGRISSPLNIFLFMRGFLMLNTIAVRLGVYVSDFRGIWRGIIFLITASEDDDCGGGGNITGGNVGVVIVGTVGFGIRGMVRVVVRVSWDVMVGCISFVGGVMVVCGVIRVVVRLCEMC